MATAVYISVFEIPPGDRPQDAAAGAECIANWEFQGETWMEALNRAYEWLKRNRDPKNTYHVWC